MTEDLNAKLAAYGMRLEFWSVADLQELAKKTKNPKKHYNKDIEAISSSIGELGFKGAVFIDKDATEIGAGIGRIFASARRGLKELPVFRILDLNKTKFKKFRIADNRLNQLSDKWDDDILFADLKEITNLGDDTAWLDFKKFDNLLSSRDLAATDFLEPIGVAEPLGSLPPPPIRESEAGMVLPTPKPRAVADESASDDFVVDFSSSNEWGIPDLVEKYQATGIPSTVVKWGEISYKKPIDDLLWTFYVDDEKFEGMADSPSKALMAMPSALVELNYSTYPTLPNALAIGQIFFKRWVSRFWQSRGFSIVVDLNVLPQFSKMNLIGVPTGWKAYATRGSGVDDTDGVALVKHDWEIAKQHSGADDADIIFLVYGGGKEVQTLCQSNGWNWVPERMQVVSNPAYAGMDGLDAKVSPDEYKDLK